MKFDTLRNNVVMSSFCSSSGCHEHSTWLSYSTTQLVIYSVQIERLVAWLWDEELISSELGTDSELRSNVTNVIRYDTVRFSHSSRQTWQFFAPITCEKMPPSISAATLFIFSLLVYAAGHICFYIADRRNQTVNMSWKLRGWCMYRQLGEDSLTLVAIICDRSWTLFCCHAFEEVKHLCWASHILLFQLWSPLCTMWTKRAWPECVQEK